MSEAAFALEWERLDNEGSDPALVTERARVFGGWLVRVGTPGAMSLAFVPDGEGRWDGEDFGEDDYEYDEEEEDDEDEEEDLEDEDLGEDDVEDGDGGKA